MYITLYVTTSVMQNAVWNCEIKSILTYLLTYVVVVFMDCSNPFDIVCHFSPVLHSLCLLYDYGIVISMDLSMDFLKAFFLH